MKIYFYFSMFFIYLMNSGCGVSQTDSSRTSSTSRNISFHIETPCASPDWAQNKQWKGNQVSFSSDGSNSVPPFVSYPEIDQLKVQFKDHKVFIDQALSHNDINHPSYLIKKQWQWVMPYFHFDDISQTITVIVEPIDKNSGYSALMVRLISY